MSESKPTLPEKTESVLDDGAPAPALPNKPASEHGGPERLDPVRYGDWEKDGRCIDF